MSTIGLIFDHQPDYLASLPEVQSLLHLPLGTGNLLDAFLNKIRSAEPEAIYIVACDTTSEDNYICIKNLPDVEVVPLDNLPELLEQQEAGDHIVIYDARYWTEDLPAASELLETACEAKTMACFTAINQEKTDAAERILFDQEGEVKRVRRLYDKVSWLQGPEPVVLAVAVPQQMAEAGLSWPLSLARTELVSQGLPSHERISSGHLFDLTDLHEVLELNRQIISAQLSYGKTPRGFHKQCAGLLIADDVGLDPSAHIVGPVVIQPGVRIEPGTTIIGPCVIGRDSLVKQKSLIARSVLPQRSIVEPTKPLVDSIGQSDGNGHVNVLKRNTLSHQAPKWKGHETQYPRRRQSSSLREKRLYLFTKRCFDMIGAGTGLILSFPLMLVTVLVQQLDSPGPVFFVHWREGRGGREFPCLKLRTMCANAHKLQKQLYARNEVDGPQFNLANDERITRIGGWLRKLNLDEVPQLINVLLGHMSLVGPRPSPFRENQICLPWRQARLAVRPGITGLWQVCRHNRGEGDFSQWICYDVAYVRHMSLLLDLKLIYYTAVSLTFGWRYVPLERLIPHNEDDHLPYHHSEKGSPS